MTSGRFATSPGRFPTSPGRFPTSAWYRLVPVALLGMLLGGCTSGEDAPSASTVEILAARGAGEAYLQQDRLDEALAEFGRLVEIAPDEPAGYAGLGLIALREGRFTDAEEFLAEARSRAPDDPELILALARIRQETGDATGARSLLLEALDRDPTHARTLWLLAAIEAVAQGPGSPAHVERLEAVAAVEPGNLAVLVELIDARLASGSTDMALEGLEAFRSLAPDLSAEADAVFAEAENAARTGDASGAAAAFAEFRRDFELTGVYQGDAVALRPPAGRLVGIPFLRFSSTDNLRVIEQDAVLAALRFADASGLSGFTDLMAARTDSAGLASAGLASALAIGDFDLDGDEDALWLDAGVGRFLRVDLGRFVDVSADLGEFESEDAGDLLFVDLDDDRRLDVYVGGPAPSFRRQLSDGTFVAVSTAAAGLVAAAGDTRRTVAADLDQDGDLDIFEARAGANRFLRNNGDWTFAEIADEAGLAGSAQADTRDVAFADIDDDLDLDLVVAEADAGIRILRNLRGGRFEDATDESGLGSAAASPAFAVALDDVDNDGRPDLIVAGPGSVTVYRGDRGGTFGPDPVASVPIAGLLPADLETFDFDNDGWIDIGVAGTATAGLADEAAAEAADGTSGLTLLRNDQSGGFEDAGRFLPGPTPALARLRSTDYNDDGDSDLVLLAANGDLALLRNDGGNANHFIQLDLMGLGEGSRKNNRFGIGARVEVRVGELLQVRTVTSPTVRFGLDGRLKADVVRVEWPNGVAQDMYFPGTDQDLIEQQSLKGSCPLLYVWDGDGFAFVGDVMWKSALGMPLGILGGGEGGGEGGSEQAYAPGYPSQEYRRLPPGVLEPRDGTYVMQMTEELWETIYVDDVDLIAVDHLDSVDVFVDERFVPPGPTELRLREVGVRHRPVTAIDGDGRDHSAALAARDYAYVSSLRQGRFQGIAEPHELVLDLGDVARAGDAVLYLTGWIFPTDASINVAMRQSDALTAEFPVLEVIDPAGSWQMAIEDLSFPSGKDKTVIIDLSGKFPTADRRVRIRTNLMIYWDDAFFTVVPSTSDGAASERSGNSNLAGDSKPAGDSYVVTTLEPTDADFHYRGFSRGFRKGGRYGPHWFDYAEVTTEPRWSDLAGTYTRYGDVTELVQSGDDMYVVANAGDEITLTFNAAALPPLREGWARTFLIYTDGWVKDGDLNTATGDRVEPLPFRTQSRYPHGPDEAYPDDAAHRRYLEEYQTRVVRPKF